jgi:glycosyltransferase involved in cell wall biosynthesis
MKILYASSLHRGGPVSHLREVVPWVAQEGVDVTVVCADDSVAASFRGNGIDAYVSPLAHKLDVAGTRAFGRLLGDADIVHTHDRRTGLLVRTQARLRGSAVVHTLHGLPEEIAAEVGRTAPPSPPGVSRARSAWLTYGYLRIESTLGRLGVVVVPSDAMRGHLVRRGFPAGRLRVVRHGVPIRTAAPPTARAATPLVVGVAANLEYWKGVDLLLEACSRLGNRVRLEIYGDGSMRTELERAADRLGVEAHFHGWVDDLPAALSRLDMLALPSRAENAPLVVLEAMASGLPVVAARVGGVPELIEDGESGLLVEPEDVDALARAIDSLARDRALRTRLAQRGQERVATLFRPENAARSLVALYEQIIAGGRR